jgi:hypothetical protein
LGAGGLDGFGGLGAGGLYGFGGLYGVGLYVATVVTPLSCASGGAGALDTLPMRV